MSIQQYQATKQGGPFALVNAPIPTPGAHQVCIRPKAVSLNAIDWKNLLFGALVQAWPAVLGIEGAGIVESIGDGVTSFKPGDEVMTWVQRTQYNGAFQDTFVTHETTVAKKPSNLTFEEATSLPITFLTAAAAVAVGLKVPLPGLTKLTTAAKPLKSVLVLGGSSGVGSAAIQLLRLSLPSASIIATSSAAHHAHLKSLGATTCLERAAQQDASALKAATPDGAGVDAIIDAVGAGADPPAVYEALKPDGPKLYAMVLTRPGVELPKGLQGSLVDARQILDAEPTAMEYLATLLEEGKYKLPLKLENVGKGFGVIGEALNRIPHNSGRKLVVSL